MAANTTGSRQAPAGSKIPAALAHGAGVRPAVTSASVASSSEMPEDSAAKPSGYGLPCAKCRLYYPANLDICPTCHHHERVSPVVPKVPPKVKQTASNPIPDSAVVEQEREEFLRQFKSQLVEAHLEIANPTGAVCTLGEHHPGDDTVAVICKACFERLQERLDLCETALQMNMKEAAQIIYDAVWADPSDPSKTYENAANALVAEIRRRAGITSLMGPFQPLSD
jgi:hypothetical protein